MRTSLICVAILEIAGVVPVLGAPQGIYGEIHLESGRRIEGFIRESNDVVRITHDGRTETFRRSKVNRIRLTRGPSDAEPKPADKGLPSDAEAEAALRQAAGAAARLRHTKHFVVAYDGDVRDAAALATRMEATYASVYRFCRANEITIVEPGRKLDVIYFDDYEDYADYARQVGFAFQGTHGFYYDRTNVAAFYNAHHDPQFLELERRLVDAHEHVAALQTALVSARDDSVEVTFPDGSSRRMSKDQAREKIEHARKQLSRLRSMMGVYSERINRLVIQHETAHQVLFNAGVHVPMGHNPPWLAEGLACVFETPPSDAGAGAGVINQMRLYDFRAGAGDGNPRQLLTAENYFAARERGDFVSLGELIADGNLFTRRDAQAGYLYAQAWALVHYLHRTKRQELAGYLEHIRRRPPDQPVHARQQLVDFEQAFGAVDEKFERRWARWVLKRRFKPIESGLPVERGAP